MVKLVEGKQDIMMPNRPLTECRVLCTPTTFGSTDPSLKAALEVAVGEVVYNPFTRPLRAVELHELVRDVDGFIAGLDEVDASVIRAANRLRVISRYGVGIDRVDINEASKYGIVVTNTPGSNSTAVAELAIAFMLALARHLFAADASTRRGEWLRFDGIGIRGKTVGLIGLGSIGREVALRLNAFGCRMLAADPFVTQKTAEEYHALLIPLEDLLPQADFVSLHAPAAPSTIKMVNQMFLARMKPGAFLINTARGDLIDEPALVKALQSGHLGGAALDCFSKEPPGKDNPLLSLPQVIVAPHTGSHTDEAINRMGRMSIENCLAVLRGEQPIHIVNPDVYKEHQFMERHGAPKD